MARYINSLLLFPAAFLTLVCSKGYTVAKATLVPSAVERPQDLVEANSKLAVSGAVAGFLIAIPGVALLKLGSAAWLLRVDVLVFVACAASALRLQVTEQRETVTPEADHTEVLVAEGEFPAPAARRDIRAKPLPPGAIQVAAFAMGMLRLIVGFMTFLVAFGFRNSHAPAWWYGVVLACSIGGNLIGAAAAPWLRGRLREEMILAGASAMLAVAGILAILFDTFNSRPAASLLAGVVGVSAGVAKLAFDALVQRHVPVATQGRAFGRFEAVFQLVWVIGGLAPVVIVMSLRTGFFVVTVAGALAAVVYVTGTRMARLGQLPQWWPGVRAPAARTRPGRTKPAPTKPAPTKPAPTKPARPPVTPAPNPPVGATIPFGTTPWTAPPPDVTEDDDRPWLDQQPGPPPDLGTYPPPIPGPPPLGHGLRPVPPPLTGPPPLAAPLAPRIPPMAGAAGDPADPE